MSDGHWLAYLADVHVLPEYRGRGLGAELVRATYIGRVTIRTFIGIAG